MDSLLKKKVDLMVDNFHELKKGFKWEYDLVKHFGAMIHATKGKTVKVEKLNEIKSYIKQETSWTSYFRGANIFLLSNLLYFEEDYERFFKDMLEVYDEMKKSGFRGSTYLPLASYTLVKEVPRELWGYKIKRMNEFYENMKKNHFWLTSSDDYVFAAVLATTDLNVEETSQNMEACYKLLNKDVFCRGNNLQTLSHILAIGEEEVEEKCEKAIKLYTRLKDKKCKLQYDGLATLGVLTLIATDVDKIVDEVKEVYDYIYEKDGYGFWKLDKSMRTMLAANLVSDFYIEGIEEGLLQVTLGNSINAIIIAQQQAAVAAACAASAAAASSSNS